ncbi:MAG: formylmethanofuran--tetrahydromethanopterin N-formyltransferase [Phycisphaeraceae bacterium]
MQLHGSTIDDAVGEAFALHAARLIVTAADADWLDAAVRTVTGYATSIIGCDAEAALERGLAGAATPDGRVGAALLFFARSPKRLRHAVRNRAGQALLTCPTTAVYDGLDDAAARFSLGRWLAPFGDGFERGGDRAGRAGVEIPVMAGTFFAEAAVGRVEAVGGGTLLLGGGDDARLLAGARRAVEAIAPLAGVITPFPAGVCRAGSRVGSRSGKLPATTNAPYCPVLRDHPEVQTRLPGGVAHVYEIVLDALTREQLVAGMQAGLHAAAGPGVGWITTGSYGGRLGNTRLPLREIAGTHP